jgi:hypothetical protein
MRKLVISAFCVLNVTAVLVMNQPEALETAKTTVLSARLSPENVYRTRYGEWMVKRYAHLAGLDNRWTMFSTLHRFDWWYVIKAIRPAGPEVLPLPLQSERSLLQRLLVDHKEAKIHLNIYNRPDWRRAYARYLCRTLAAAHDPAGFVVYELHHQSLLERAQAAASGRHLEPSSHAQVVDAVMCAGSPLGSAGG